MYLEVLFSPLHFTASAIVKALQVRNYLLYFKLYYMLKLKLYYG